MYSVPHETKCGLANMRGELTLLMIDLCPTAEEFICGIDVFCDRKC